MTVPQLVSRCPLEVIAVIKYVRGITLKTLFEGAELQLES